jgi:hypothetical protein
VLIVVRVVNMVIVPFVVMIHVVILVVAIVIVHHAASSVIDRLVVMIQALTHVVAIVIARLVVMVQALVAHRARVVMTAVMPETEMTGAVVLVVRISRLADQRTKPNVVVKPCAHVAAVKCVKTANKLRCHAKPRLGLMKAELKMKSAMLPKVQCAERSHRDALCRRDQKMKTN